MEGIGMNNKANNDTNNPSYNPPYEPIIAKTKSSIKAKFVPETITDPELLAWKRKHEGVTCIDVRI